MKIVIDDKIPFIKGVLESHAEVVYLPGASIQAKDLVDADALVIRTRTQCNEALLKDSAVKIIVTATIGYDHIDVDYCKSKGIVWKNAPGCNSGSVMQYLAAVLATLYHVGDKNWSDLCIGIVGVGQVGKKVAKLCQALGMKVLLNDPPRAQQEGQAAFVDLSTIQAEADIITLHTPLQYEGAFANYHLVNKNFLAACKTGCTIINTCRGEVVNNAELKESLKSKTNIAHAVLDCWEQEPNIDQELLQLCLIGTPHIAGYSYDGKANGTTASVQHLCDFFGWNNSQLKDWKVATPTLMQMSQQLATNSQGEANQEASMAELILRSYPILEDSEQLKAKPKDFEQQRGNYRKRYEFHNYQVKLVPNNESIQLLCQKIGFITD